MNDNELDRLKAAMRAATPQPDCAKKAANLALARERFDLIQGSADVLRQTPESPEKGMVTRVMMMLNLLSSRAALTAAAAIAAAGILVLPPIIDALGPPPMSVSREESALEFAKQLAPNEQLWESNNRLDAADGVLLFNSAAEPAWPAAEGNTEEFANAEDGSVRIAAENPVSTFSIDVDTASYSVVRSSLMNGYLPPPEAVRVEEMINYFPYEHPVPEGDMPFRPAVSIIPTPWNSDTKLLQIAIQGALPEVENRPPLNLVFLIDTSGSMDQANKLPLLKLSLRLLLGQLRPEDEVAMVTYAGSAGQVLNPTLALNRDAIRTALDELHAGGPTAGKEGLQQAYSTGAGNDSRRRGDTGHSCHRRRLQCGAV